VNADVDKIRKSRIFKSLPDRAFEKVLSVIKVRAFQNCEEVLNLSSNFEFTQYFGYVIQGRVLFLASDSKPLGLAIKDEFFLGRAFSLGGQSISRLMSAADGSLVIFIPKDIVSSLSKASDQFAETLEDMYESIFERSKLISQDANAAKTIQDWIVNPDGQKTLMNWVGVIEKKRLQAIEKRKKDQDLKSLMSKIWILMGAFLFAITVESFGRYWGTHHPFVHKLLPYFELDRFEPGTRWNILLGSLGYFFLVLTLFHSLVKWGIRKRKWKISFPLSQQLHIFFGVAGSYLVVLHTGFHMSGANIAYWALYAVLIGLFTGFVGQFISSQVPTTIRGEKLKLDAMKAEQQKLQQKAEMLLNSQQMYKTSVLLISKGVSNSFWGNLFQSPLLFLRAIRVRSELQNLGLGSQGAAVAAELIRREFQIKQKIRFLESANMALKKWLVVHKPVGYAIYGLGLIHMILAILSL